MATTFRVHIAGWSEREARQAASAAFEELHRLERLFSRFIDGSDIDRINHAPPGNPVRVRADTFECLKASLAMEQLTDGAFNITARPISYDTEPFAPASSAAQALALDEDLLIVARIHSHTRVDLGGIGKGFAVDAMVQLLKDWEVPNALVDAGGSTIFAYSESEAPHPWSASMQTDRQIATLEIDDFAFAASGTSVKGDHIVDGRTGKAPDIRTRTWALAENAAKADALSTAFFIMSDSQIEKLCADAINIGAAWSTLDQDGESIAQGVGRLSKLNWDPQGHA